MTLRVRRRWPSAPSSQIRSASARLLGTVDDPVDGSTVPRARLTLRGWAANGEGTIAGVVISVDGVAAALARTGLHRPDVAAVHPSLQDAERSGWTAEVDLGQCTGSTADVTVAVLQRDGTSPCIGRVQLTLSDLTPAPPAPHRVPDAIIDQPARGSEVDRGPLWIAGRAIFASGPAASVEITLDGASLGRARLGMPRPEVHRLPLPGAVVSGFSALVDLATLPVESERITVGARARGMSGEELTLDPVSVWVRPLPPAPEDAAAATPPATGGSPLLRRRPTLSPPRSQPRVLAVTHHLGLGGGQLYLQELLRRLRLTSNFATTVVAPGEGPLGAELEAIGVDLHLTGDCPVGSMVEYEAWLQELAAWADPLEFDVVVVNTMGAFHGADLAERLGRPCVWAIHESFDLPLYWSHAFPAGGLHAAVRMRAERALGKVAALVFEADATRRLYEPYAPAARLITLPYGLDLRRVDAYRLGFDKAATRRLLGVPEAATVLLCLGTVEPRKAQAPIVQAFEAIARERGEVHLVLVGDQGGDYSEAIHEYVRRAGLEEHVSLIATTADTYPWYGVADIMVCASDVESMPRSVLEAMAFEVPVLATAIFGLPELIAHGRTGWLCADRDVAALREALRAVLALDPRARRSVGIAAARVVHERHDSAGYANAYERLIRALVEDPQALPGVVLAGG